MSLSSNTAQMRELTELRNHLKWLDEERRKSSRKMAELEQRLAQQGRELSDRDQKIHELEAQIANVGQRIERLPDVSSDAAETEQRLHDLEWHVSSMNAQLTKLLSPEDVEKRWQEERAQIQEEIAQAINATHERVETSQSVLEGQLRSEIVALRDTDERRNLVAQLAEHAAEIDALEGSVSELSARLYETTNSVAADTQANISSVQEAIAELSARLRETTSSLAAETQTNISSLVANIQKHLDSRTQENEARMEAITAEWQTRMEGISSPIDLTPDIQRIDQQLSELSKANESWMNHLGQVEQTLDERISHLGHDIEKLGNFREIVPLMDRFEQELELRQAEELRLANLIGAQEDRLAALVASLDELTASEASLINRLSSSERSLEGLEASVRDINDNVKPDLIEATHRLAPIADRITALSNFATKAETRLEALSTDQSELRDRIINTVDDLQQNQNDVARQLESWQATMDENKDTIERFTQQWITLSNQYKEARMAVQNFAHWQKQLEQQKREASEMLRLESSRMNTRWDGFIQEIQERLKNFEIELNQRWQAFEMENEQKWSSARRSEKVWREEIAAVDELIQKLQQDNRNLIWRVQSAQADAIKKWPRLLMEEVEKAVEINPNRRLTSVTTPPPGEMSVVDAIEQGLITIDYNDDTAVDS